MGKSTIKESTNSKVICYIKIDINILLYSLDLSLLLLEVEQIMSLKTYHSKSLTLRPVNGRLSTHCRGLDMDHGCLKRIFMFMEDSNFQRPISLQMLSIKLILPHCLRVVRI